MSVLFALVSAFANAGSVVVQHIASRRSPPSSTGWRLVLYLLRSPLWWLGWIAIAGGFLFQAAALHNGLVSIVQTLLVTELVFVLVIRAIWIHQAVRTVTWISAVVTCVGAGVFVAVSEPRGGSSYADSRAWSLAVLECAVPAAVMAVAARWGSPARRAALYATATGLVAALLAVFIKATTDTLSEFGVGGMFTHWPVYALIVAGIANIVLTQAALHAGPLSVSQPLMVIVTPIVSIILSVVLFGEHFTQDTVAVTVAAVAFVLMCLGVVALTKTAPATMEPSAA